MRQSILFIFSLFLFGVVSAQNPYPLVPIDSIQFVSASKLSAGNTEPDYVTTKGTRSFGDTVQVEGIITFDPMLYALSTSRKSLWMQRASGAPWSGVEVMVDPIYNGSDPLAQLITNFEFYDNGKKGFKVRATGIIREFQGSTQLQLIKINTPNFTNTLELVSFNPVNITPAQVNIADLMIGNINSTTSPNIVKGEQWEGVYVEVRNVTIFSRLQGISGNSSRWAWSIGDSVGNVMDIRDVSAWYRNDQNEADSAVNPGFSAPPVGTRYEYIRGVIVEYSVAGVPRYGIAPLLSTDIGPELPSSPIVRRITRNPKLVQQGQNVTITAEVVGSGTSTVSSVDLYYAVGFNNTSFTQVPMTAGANNLFTGTIPGQIAGSIVKYWIKAVGSNGLYINSPDSLASNSLFLVVGPTGINSIRMIQETPFTNGNSIWMNDTIPVNIRGIVTSTNSDLGVVTFQSGTDPYSAIFIEPGTALNDSVGNWQRGDSILITSAVVQETFNVTTLYNVGGANHTKISSGNALPPFIKINMDSVIAKRYNYTEPYEGMLVELDSVYMVKQNADAPQPNNGEWMVNEDSNQTTGLRVDDLSFDIPFDYATTKTVNKQLYRYLRGVLYYSFNFWKVEPRDFNDLDLFFGPDFLEPELKLIGKNPDSVALHSASYVDPGALAFDAKDGNISSGIEITGSVDTHTLGTYTLTYKVQDAAGNRDSITRTVIVYGNITPGFNELNSDLNVSVFPSPAKNILNVNVSGNVDMGTIELMDLTGRTIKSVKMESNSNRINVSDLTDGFYLCRIQSGNLTKTVKIIISQK